MRQMRTTSTIFTLTTLSALLMAMPGCGADTQGPKGENAESGGNSNASGGAENTASGGTVSGESGGSTQSSSGGMENSAIGGNSSNTSGGSESVGAGGSESVGAGGSESVGAGGSESVGAGGSENTGGGEGAMTSTGCGQAPPQSGQADIEVDGQTREYILALPDDYDANKAYRLIFTWHPWGGSAQQVAGNGPSGYYGLLGASNGEAILVSPEGLDFGGNGLGWGNEGGQDIDFLNAMLERFDSELCFDPDRVFSTGFSFGGMMSNAVACAGLARAVAPMAGNSSVAGCADGTTPVAYMGFHGDADSVVELSGGETARDVFIERNGCGAAMASDSDWCELAGGSYQPCACTSYEGCTDGYPVTWCEFSGSHMPAPNSGETIWEFFAQF